MIKIRVKINKHSAYYPYWGRKVYCADHVVRTLMNHPTKPYIFILRYPDHKTGESEWWEYTKEEVENNTRPDGGWKLLPK